jgi:glycosyltransferase involved in cell wall biosynthesis
MKKILYLSYTGLLEPLGRSQILAYLSRLSNEYQFTIVSFEKDSDFTDMNTVESLQKECETLGINWQPKIYHHKPRLLATLYDLLVLFYFTWSFSRGDRAQAVHCRSYIPAIAAWFVGKFTKVPFIFDMRALWPEEMIEAGRLERNSLVHRTLQWLELKLLKDAAHVVSLTQAAVNYLQSEVPELSNQEFSVITTCVDLDNFNFEQPAGKSEKLGAPDSISAINEIGTMGTVISGWYYLDWLFTSFQCELKINPNASFKIVTRDSKEQLMKLANEYDIPEALLEIRSSAPQSIAENIKDMKAGLLFFTPGISKLGSAPTRMGEFLACGIPIIGNRGVGDMADLIERYNVGVVIENGEVTSIEKALKQLDELIGDEDLTSRCRLAAEEYFSADKGAESYRKIYQALT